jgi:hypothetical protein
MFGNCPSRKTQILVTGHFAFEEEVSMIAERMRHAHHGG